MDYEKIIRQQTLDQSMVEEAEYMDDLALDEPEEDQLENINFYISQKYETFDDFESSFSVKATKLG